MLSDNKPPRERVLEASLELFVDKGYFNTNIPDISKLSGCSVGSIYHHFLNKEEIASVLYSEAIIEFRAHLSTEFSQDAKQVSELSIQQTISILVTSFLDFSELRPKLSRYIWMVRHNEFLNESLTRPTMIGFDSLGRSLSKAFKNAQRAGEIRDYSAEIIWNILFGIPLSFVMDWLDGYTRESPIEVSSRLSEAAAAALCLKV